MLKLSQAFIREWEEYYKQCPAGGLIEKIIQESVHVQRFQELSLCDGRCFRVLDIFWNPEWEIIIKVDDSKKVVVSLKTGKAKKRSKHRNKVRLRHAPSVATP